MTNLATDLAACVEALEKATPGEWFGKQATVYMHLRAKGDKYGDPYIMEAGRRGQVLSSHDARAIASSVNFLRTHAPAIAELQARCEALEQDRARLDLLDSWRGDNVRRDQYGDPELVGHYWGVQGQCYDVREAIDREHAAIDASREVGNG